MIRPGLYPIFALLSWLGTLSSTVQAGVVTIPTPLPSTMPSPVNTRRPATPAGRPVLLFGQPCVLSGPYEGSVLDTIHSVSPEQIPAIVTDAQAKAGIDRLKKATELPPELERYRDRLSQRLEAQLAFPGALLEAQKSGKSDTFIARVKKFLQGKRGEDFESAFRRAAQKRKLAQWQKESIQPLRALYDDAIEPHPEADFHSVIQKLGVKYDCSFEEDEEG